jgi:hypothetical protein
MSCGSRYCAEQLRLEDKFALLVLLAGFVSLVVLPADCLFALPAVNVAYDMPASRHVALVRIGLGTVDDAVEKVCFAVLTAEILGCVSMQVRGFAREAWERTLLRISSWLERWVLQFLHPYMREELR